MSKGKAKGKSKIKVSKKSSSGKVMRSKGRLFNMFAGKTIKSIKGGPKAKVLLTAGGMVK